MKTWAYRLLFDLTIASKQELYEADQVVGHRSIVGKRRLRLSFCVRGMVTSWLSLAMGAVGDCSAVIDLMYRQASESRQ
jgi:hypothetical protein